MSLLLAQGGDANLTEQCPLLGVSGHETGLELANRCAMCERIKSHDSTKLKVAQCSEGKVGKIMLAANPVRGIGKIIRREMIRAAGSAQ
jgi:hypothetical protein